MFYVILKLICKRFCSVHCAARCGPTWLWTDRWEFWFQVSRFGQSISKQDGTIRGGDLGDGPPKFWGGGTAHALVPPIFREVVLSDVCERMNRVKQRKIWKTRSMTKKRSSEILGVKMDRENGHFSGKNRHFRNFGPRKIFPSPQTRRQVSATDKDIRV